MGALRRKMGENGCILLFHLFLFWVTTCSASANFISGDVFDCSHGSTGRSLLQQKKSCPLNFETMNYTVITSQCKGPLYAPKLCCEGFKEFACPFADQINDGSNDCATTMFSYINLYGKYPPGLFASECREGKQGLECPENSTSSSNDSSNSAHWGQRSSSTVAVFVAVFLLFMVLLF